MNNVAPEVLYQNLLALCETDAFFFKDFPSDEQTTMYRIFNYRLASYTDFLMPSALECRGTMFLVGRDGSYVDLVCRPQKKFFNLNENPMTMGLDLTNLYSCMVKEDGSLMSTYIHTNGELRLKSKGSTGSEQANDAMKFLKTQPALLADLRRLAARDFTVNLEWTAPWNRIVVGYEKANLVGLSVVDNETGIMYGADIVEDMELWDLLGHWVEQFEYDGDLIEVVKNMVGGEGVVAITENGVPFKLKGDWYLSLHRNKDSVSNSKALIELVLMEKVDDLKSLFVGDAQVLAKINAYEVSISNVYNRTVQMVELFHTTWNHLDTKHYALKAMEFYNGHWGFHVQMFLRNGKGLESKLKQLMISHANDYILKEFEKDSAEN
ncbi:RNA ligase [compost metagenome]